MKNKNGKEILYNSDAKEEYIMPDVAEVEIEVTEYIRGMERYLEKLKSMPEDEAKEYSHHVLIDMGLIDENGEFTDAYSGSREYYRSLKENAEV